MQWGKTGPGASGRKECWWSFERGSLVISEWKKNEPREESPKADERGSRADAILLTMGSNDPIPWMPSFSCFTLTPGQMSLLLGSLDFSWFRSLKHAATPSWAGLPLKDSALGSFVLGFLVLTLAQARVLSTWDMSPEPISDALWGVIHTRWKASI